jgi:hypothetical protein
MNKLIFALTAALFAGSAMAANVPKPSPASVMEKPVAAPKSAKMTHHHKVVHHYKTGKKVHQKHAA